LISFEFNSPYFLKIVFKGTLFERRKDSGSLNDCLISVDGTDVCIPQQGPDIPGNPFFFVEVQWVSKAGTIVAVWMTAPSV
jgi:hypothetical protein